MKNTLLRASALTLIVLGGSFAWMAIASSDAAKGAADAQTLVVVAATTAFLSSLDADQREKVEFPFTPPKTARAARFNRSDMGGGPGGSRGDNHGSQGRPGGPVGGRQGPGGGGPGMGPAGGFVGEQYGEAIWSNYPVSDVPRPGLRLGSLTPAQREAAMHVLQVMLSVKGYQKILDIMGSDQALSESGTPFASGIGAYTIGVFGSPSATTPWMFEFGGHHLGLNLTIAAEHGVLTPTLTGAQPAIYTANGKSVRVLAQENDKAFAFLHALDDMQRKQAILNYRIDDLVLGPGHAGETLQPEGLKVSALSGRQRAMLLDVISEWAGIVSDAYATTRMAEIKAGLDDTYFAWSGPTTHEPGKNGSAYYRIQGPKLVIEFSPQGVGGDSTMHVHTIYRDPTNDYGIQFTGAQ